MRTPEPEDLPEPGAPADTAPPEAMGSDERSPGRRRDTMDLTGATRPIATAALQPREGADSISGGPRPPKGEIIVTDSYAPVDPDMEASREGAYASMRQEFMQTVADSLEHLPLRQRQVVTMRYYESRSLEEISELLDIREATVRTLLRHGVNNLRRYFKRSYLDPANDPGIEPRQI
ncbi:MAG: RNA polymerase sigma factor [Armatimonadetes bacterium]|nr:RNA polymerase sigma factor [Armatimonadota bacterium]